MLPIITIRRNTTNSNIKYLIKSAFWLYRSDPPDTAPTSELVSTVFVVFAITRVSVSVVLIFFNKSIFYLEIFILLRSEFIFKDEEIIYKLMISF